MMRCQAAAFTFSFMVLSFTTVHFEFADRGRRSKTNPWLWIIAPTSMMDAMFL
jgi:hypothetical protein